MSAKKQVEISKKRTFQAEDEHVQRHRGESEVHSGTEYSSVQYGRNTDSEGKFATEQQRVEQGQIVRTAWPYRPCE